MNLIHNWLCQSTGWRRVLETRVPWALKDLAFRSFGIRNGNRAGAGYGHGSDGTQYGERD